MDRELINDVIFRDPRHYRWIDFLCVLIISISIGVGMAYAYKRPQISKPLPSVQYLQAAPIQHENSVKASENAFQSI